MGFKVVVLDMDGTILHYDLSEYGSSWDAVHNAAGTFQEHKKLVDKYLDNRKLYDEWVEKSFMLLKGKKVSEIERKILPPPYTPNVKEVTDEIRGMNIKRGLVSAGLDIVAEYARNDLGLDFCECNILGQKNGLFTGTGESKVCYWDKARNLKEVCARFGAETNEAVVVGDHDSEIPMFKISGLGIAYRPKTESIRKAADVVVTDLREIPAIIRKF
jgi:HAD superfamily phosphoserine phosphatase-like hydrolase